MALNKSKNTHVFIWFKGDNPYKYTKRIVHDIYVMWPRIRVFGIRYLFDFNYRNKCRAKLSNDRRKALYGSSYLSKRKKIRQRLMVRDGMGCNRCFLVNTPLTIDHIVPVGKGGNSHISNLQLLCTPCHVAKSYEDSKGYEPVRRSLTEWEKRDHHAPVT